MKSLRLCSLTLLFIQNNTKYKNVLHENTTSNVSFIWKNSGKLEGFFSQGLSIRNSVTIVEFIHTSFSALPI